MGDGGAAYTPGSDITLYAKWTENPPPPAPAPSSHINTEPFKQKFESPLYFDGGRIDFSPDSAGIGDTVTLTVTPDAGKKLESLVIDRIGGEPLPNEEKGGGVYTFEMPGWRLAFRATFVSDTQPESEEQPLPPGNVAGVVLSPQTIMVNGAAVKVEAYNIGGNNFFGLRELAPYFGYGADYDEATNTAIIESR